MKLKFALLAAVVPRTVRTRAGTQLATPASRPLPSQSPCLPSSCAA